MDAAALPGVVFLVLDDDRGARSIQRLIKDAVPRVADGRLLVAIWDEAPGWQARFPTEALLTRAVMGPDATRPRDGWGLFGGGVARTYATGANPGRRPVRTVLWVAFQAPGERALRRRRTADHGIVEASTLPVADPAFTRDVANNIWHLRDDGWLARVLDRLAPLLMWSDERALVLGARGTAKSPYAPLDLVDAVIPVAKKERYAWRDEPTLF